jgi:hypothetical protein
VEPPHGRPPLTRAIRNAGRFEEFDFTGLVRKLRMTQHDYDAG